MVNKKKLLTARVLADKLDLTVETIWKYTRENKIPYIKLGTRQYRYRLKNVIRALNSSPVKEKKAKYNPDESKKYTYRDYLELPEEPGYKFEVLEGMLVKEPSPNVLHQRVSRRLLQILKDYFRKVDPDGEIFYAPLDVTFNETNVVQPDILYISGEQKEIIKEKRIKGSPLLVIEIISPYSSRKDRVQKMNIYRKEGVQHYWLVNPEEKTFESFVLRDNTYSLIASGMDTDTIEHPVFNKLNIPLEKLWKE
ncbi:MAG: Uma2 family endonuclease [Halanaerobiaceae bacterium]